MEPPWLQGSHPAAQYCSELPSPGFSSHPHLASSPFSFHLSHSSFFSPWSTLIFLLPLFREGIIWDPGWPGFSPAYPSIIVLTRLSWNVLNACLSPPSDHKCFKGEVALVTSCTASAWQSTWGLVCAPYMLSWETYFLFCITLKPEWTLAFWLIPAQGLYEVSDNETF